MSVLEKILRVAVRGGASDVIIKTGAVPRFRFNGDLITLSDGEVVTPEVMDGWLKELMPPNVEKKFRETGDADFGFQARFGTRFRVNAFRQRQVAAIVMRVISTHIRTLEELQLPGVLSSLTLEKRGLVLVSGATGSGKTTTLAAMIQKINMERAAHIITIEDPIEFNFVDQQATIEQREVGIDTENFQSALRAALRQNPDVILVGELRDKDTVETALMAAETGHLVLATLHTNNTVETLNRILSFFPPHQHTALRGSMSTTIKAIISQRLVPRANTRGQVAAVEVLINTATISECIAVGERFDAIYDAIRDGGDTYGMQTFDQSILELYNAGEITEEEAIAQASNKSDMKLAMRGVGA